MVKGQKVIAVVDHDLGSRTAADAVLTAFAFRTELYTTAEEFIVALPKTRANCVLVDFGLRDITGIELSRHLQASGVRIPTVFIGTPDDVARRCAVELGCVTVLAKPFSAQQLIEAVVTATGSNPHFDR